MVALSYRQVKRIFQRFRTRGQKGLIHGNVGQRSNRAHTPAVRTEAMALIAEHFSGTARGVGQRFGPTLAAEQLAEEFGLVIPVPTLRRWMLAERLWSRLRKSKRAHRRRAPRGELVQMDGSFHAWLEDRGPVECLLTMIDDATGETLGHTARGLVAQREASRHTCPTAIQIPILTGRTDHSDFADRPPQHRACGPLSHRA